MKWDEQINKVIDYIEKNIENVIDMDKVANIMHQSKISFQRTFSLVMNISINEYIRRRRMTLAAIELQNSSEKVIDLALKYGYESPVSFTRSFKDIHGISPSAARKKDAKLNLYPRITCLLTVKGDMQMDNKTKNAGEQDVNRKGFNWATWKSPNLKVFDTCISTAFEWREAGHKDLLDLGTGLGQNAIYFAKQGFNVSAIDISDYAVQYVNNWAKIEGLTVKAEAGDMHCLPYPQSSFDCVYAYHVVSHTDSVGVRNVISEIERVLKPGGEVYLSFSSKESAEFTDNWWPKYDENTLISQNEAELGIPHFYANLNDIKQLLSNFSINRIKHTEHCVIHNSSDDRPKQMFFYVNASLKGDI